LRHCSSAARCTSAANSASPARQRTVRIEVAVSRSSLANCSSDFGEWAAWPSFRLASHIGYHSCSATSRTVLSAAFCGCNNTTSMSLPGVSVPRA
jgi:hypothetical protein